MAKKTNLGKALNVYGTNTASTGRNVCLYTDTPSDTMQKWKYSEDSGVSARLHSTVNNNYVLDRSDGSVSGSANNNAHLCSVGSTGVKDSALTFINVSGNICRIRLTNRIKHMAVPDRGKRELFPGVEHNRIEHKQRQRNKRRENHFFRGERLLGPIQRKRKPKVDF